MSAANPCKCDNCSVCEYTQIQIDFRREKQRLKSQVYRKWRKGFYSDEEKEAIYTDVNRMVDMEDLVAHPLYVPKVERKAAPKAVKPIRSIESLLKSLPLPRQTSWSISELMEGAGVRLGHPLSTLPSQPSANSTCVDIEPSVPHQSGFGQPERNFHIDFHSGDSAGIFPDYPEQEAEPDDSEQEQEDPLSERLSHLTIAVPG